MNNLKGPDSENSKNKLKHNEESGPLGDQISVNKIVKFERINVSNVSADVDQNVYGER